MRRLLALLGVAPFLFLSPPPPAKTCAMFRPQDKVEEREAAVKRSVGPICREVDKGVGRK